MIKIKETIFKNGVDYILENTHFLYTTDWNGEKYIDDFNKRIYKPIYKQADINNYDLIGFEED